MIVEVRNLRKEFDGTVAVDDISLTVDRGETVGMVGPNGAGKSTTMQMMLGLTTPSSGSIKIFGLDLEKHRIRILQRVNFASAYVYLPHNLKVWENLFVFAGLYKVKNFKAKMNELLEMFEIGHLRDRITGCLSLGEQTRVNLCKALLNEPDLLLLDEPTASLDPDIADKVRKLMRRIQTELKIAVIYTSHNMRDVQELCDRVLFINRGQIVAEGSPDELAREFQHASLEEVFITIARNSNSTRAGV